MNAAKSMKCCMRLLRQKGWPRVPHELQAGAVGIDQCRNYRSDEHHGWPAKRGDDAGAQINQIYGEESTFDPRYDDRHYKIYRRNENLAQHNKANWNSSMKDPESRRRITQDTQDHQRSQERIIMDNKRRWQQRSEPKSPAELNSEYSNSVYGYARRRRSRRREGEDQSAEEYSRQRRHQRLTEVKRQARELRESRKGYNLPKSEFEEPLQQQQQQQQPDTQYASREWLDKQAIEDEAKYWHTWSTCPDERRTKERAAEIAEDADDDYAPGHKTSQPRGLVKPMLPYDSRVRRFQTHSRQLAERSVAPPLAPPDYVAAEKASARRRPSGMEKQFQLARDFNRSSTEHEEAFRLPTSLLQSHTFKAPTSVYAEVKAAAQMSDIELPRQPLRAVLDWQGLPRPVYKRFDGINRAIVQRKKTRKCVQPPRYSMTLTSKTLKRRRTPIDSFSNMLAVNTRYIPHSEYTGYGRQTVCDAWQDFTSAHSLKPIF